MDTPSGVSARRRALRKGTRSCIECKRRKTRCIFLISTDNQCVGCRHRGTSCLSQEFTPESAIPAATSGSVDDELTRRLDRFEKLLGQMRDKIIAEHAKSAAVGKRATTTIETLPSPKASPSSANDVFRSEIHDSAITSLRRSGNSADIRRTLYEALPSAQDAEILLGNGRTLITIRALCNPFNEIFWHGHSRTIPITATLPTATDHPTVIARSLLRVALSLQQLHPSFDYSRLQLQESPGIAAARYFNLATTLVTSNDNIVDTLEGLECLILEAVYLINTGNLRRCLLHTRRSLTLAQFMGLPTSPSRVPPALDPDTWVSFTVFFNRIIYAERYLSLVLGVPTAISQSQSDPQLYQTINDTSFAPTDRLDMFHALVAGRIASKNNESAGGQHISSTQKLENEFQAIMQALPADWWSPPNLLASSKGAIDALISDSLTCETQIIHFKLRAVLHLPHLLSDDTSEAIESSKSICLSSCREVLRRYNLFRSVVEIVACCRLVDWCAFTGALALILVHLVAHQRANSLQSNFESDLMLRRLEDLAIIESALTTMDRLNALNNDPISRQTAELVRNLLSVEADAAAGKFTYDARSGPDAWLDDGTSNTNEAFNVQVPSFGNIKIAQRPLSTTNKMSRSAALDISTQPSNPDDGIGLIQDCVPGNLHYSDFALQDTYGNPLQHVGPHPHEIESMASFLPVPQVSSANQQEMPVDMASASINNYAMQISASLEDVNAWAFQGIDDMVLNTMLRDDTNF